MNEHQKTAQTSKGVLGEGGVALFMVAIMCIVALTAVVSVDVHAEDASKTSDVYSGIATDYDGLADGATYKVASGGIVYIWYGENDISEIGSQLDGTGLAINAESKSIEGEIEKTCYIKIADKTVCLECVGVIYGSNPVYGDTVLEALPVAYVGQKYEHKFEVTSGSGILGVGVLDDYNIHTSDFDPAEYGLSVSFSSERSPAAYMTGKRSPISRGKRGDSGKRILVSMRSEANASPMAALSLDISPASLPIVSASTEAASYRGLSGSGKAIASLYALSLSPVRAAMVS